MNGQPFIPAAGKDWLLPLYDPFTWLLGVERFHRRLVAQAAITPGCRVLEIGCGTGNLTILAKRLCPDADVVGTDPDPKALARAGRKARRRGIGVQFEAAYAETLPYPDGSFDRVLSALMLHHLERETKLAALREVRRVLRPGGTLHVVDFHAEAHASGGLHDALARRVHGQPRVVAPDRLLDLMRDAGLTEAQEVGRQFTIVGRIVYCRGERSREHTS